MIANCTICQAEFDPTRGTSKSFCPLHCAPIPGHPTSKSESNSSDGNVTSSGVGCLVLIVAFVAILMYSCSGSKPNQPAPTAPNVSQNSADTRPQLPVAPKETAAESRTNRIDYAKAYEHLMLQGGVDATVRTTGKNADTLVITYVLVNRPFVYNTMNDSDTTSEWKELGFKNVRFSDGYEQSWTQNLQ